MYKRIEHIQHGKRPSVACSRKNSNLELKTSKIIFLLKFSTDFKLEHLIKYRKVMLTVISFSLNIFRKLLALSSVLCTIKDDRHLVVVVIF